MRNLGRSVLWVSVALLTLGGLIVVACFGVEIWEWLRYTPPTGSESNGATLRNLALILAAFLAFPLAIWRGYAADRQAKASVQQSDTSLQALLNDRFQRSAEMLGHERLSVRLGGIYTLGSLAKEHPDRFHLPIVQLFCGFVRNPTKDESLKPVRNRDQVHLREDVREIVTLIVNRTSEQQAIESQRNFKLDFNRARLEGANFAGAHLRGAEFFLADLSWASFENADLSSVSLRGARLKETSFKRAHISGTLFSSPYESFEDDFWKGFHSVTDDPEDPDYLDEYDSAKDFTQEQLDECIFDSENPPFVYGVKDADTGDPLSVP